MIKTFRFVAVFLVYVLFSALHIDGQNIDQLDAISTKNEISFNGLTGTLSHVIRRQQTKTLRLGSHEISLENLFDIDISSIIECDSSIQKYMNSGDEDLYYENLTNAMELEIRQKFKEDDGSIFVIVDASERDNNMFFSFYIAREKQVTMPIEIAVDNTRASFDVDCAVKLIIDCNLMIDSDEVNNGDMLKGLQAGFNEFSIELAVSNDTDKIIEKTGTLHYLDNMYKTVMKEIDFSANINWYLTSDFENDDEYIYFYDLTQGNYQWDSFYDSSMQIELTAQNAVTEFDLHYTADDLFSENGNAEITIENLDE